jgi:hypothetical protein
MGEAARQRVFAANRLVEYAELLGGLEPAS